LFSYPPPRSYSNIFNDIAFSRKVFTIFWKVNFDNSPSAAVGESSLPINPVLEVFAIHFPENRMPKISWFEDVVN
jgi:hypothetical protein